MCHDRSWFASQEAKKAAERKPETKDKRSETVDALLRHSNEGARVDAERPPTREAAPAK